MRAFFTFLLGLFSIGQATVILLILYLGFQMTYLQASGYSALAGLITFFGVKWIADYRFLKRNRLTRKDYAYIRKNLLEAKRKMNRLTKASFNVRTVGAFKQLYELSRLTKRMYSIVKKEPRRFYQSERFFFYHLDSVVELSERYAYLASQPIKNDEIYISLKETKSTLEDLSKTIKKDIYEVLSSDVDELQFELNVAKHSLKKLGDHPFDDERSTKK